MKGRPIGFAYTTSREPHIDRAKEILRRHPELRQFFGKNRHSMLAIVTLVGLQMSLAVWSRDQAWWATLLLAYGVGAFVTHALLVMVHECTHNLIFKRRTLNVLAGILAGLPSVLLNSVIWARYHLEHHRYQGVYERDLDLPSRWEAELIGRASLGKALWLLLFPLFQAARLLRNRDEIEAIKGDRWVLANYGAQVGFILVVGVFLGAQAFVYLLGSLFFSTGLHPLGGRLIQEHFLIGERQETYSYYGPLNLLAFNVGHHNEHHDFPSVAWNNLPNIKRLAPEWYDTLVSHRSWTALLLRFLVDRNLGLFHRMARWDAVDLLEGPSVGTAGAPQQEV